MKNVKNVKSIFIKISRICLGAFFVALAILIGFAVTSKGEELTLPTIMGIYFILSTILALICIVIAWILDAMEGIRRDKASFLAGYAVATIGLCVVIVVIDYFMNNGSVDWLNSLLRTSFVVCAIRAGQYVFTKQNSD